MGRGPGLREADTKSACRTSPTAMDPEQDSPHRTRLGRCRTPSGGTHRQCRVRTNSVGIVTERRRGVDERSGADGDRGRRQRSAAARTCGAGSSGCLGRRSSRNCGTSRSPGHGPGWSSSATPISGKSVAGSGRSCSMPRHPRRAWCRQHDPGLLTTLADRLYDVLTRCGGEDSGSLRPSRGTRWTGSFLMAARCSSTTAVLPHGRERS